MVKLLLQKGAEIKARDKDSWTALMFAASGENLKVIGAGVKDGKAIITYGDSGGNLDVINLLLENGLDVNGGDKDGYTPLITAAYIGHVAVVERLLPGKGRGYQCPGAKRQDGTRVAKAKGHADVIHIPESTRGEGIVTPQ